MHRTKRADRGPVLNHDMPSQSRSVGHDHVIANHTVVRDVSVCHDQTVVAQASHSAALRRSAIDGHILADDIVIAYLKSRWFACVADVLWGKADGGEREKSIAGADFRGAIDHYVRDQLAAAADLDIVANRAIRPNFA